MITNWIKELVQYGKETQLVEADDEVYVTNRLLELFGISEYEEPEDI